MVMIAPDNGGVLNDAGLKPVGFVNPALMISQPTAVYDQARATANLQFPAGGKQVRNGLGARLQQVCNDDFRHKLLRRLAVFVVFEHNRAGVLLADFGDFFCACSK